MTTSKFSGAFPGQGSHSLPQQVAFLCIIINSEKDTSEANAKSPQDHLFPEYCLQGYIYIYMGWGGGEGGRETWSPI